MPTLAQKQYHHNSVLSKRHADRMARGVKESDPSEYAPMVEGSAEDKRRREAARVIEERRWARELGL